MTYSFSNKRSLYRCGTKTPGNTRVMAVCGGGEKIPLEDGSFSKAQSSKPEKWI
jgi:hypothetical protein